MAFLYEKRIKAVCKCIFLVILLVFSNHNRCTAEEPPRILPDNEDKRIIFASLGQTFSVRCPVKNVLFIEWVRGNHSLYLEDHYRITDNGMLKIKEVTMQDVGLYTCIATNGYGSISVDIVVLVYRAENISKQDGLNQSSGISNLSERIRKVPPNIIKRPSAKVFQGEIGGSVAIPCVAIGFPAPYIFWLKDDNLLDGQNAETRRSLNRTESTIYLRNLKASDTGNYRCIAKNNNGKDQVDFSLSVIDPFFPPKIVSLQPPESRVLASHTTVFKCEVQSKHGIKVHIKWYKEVTEGEIQEFNTTFLRMGTRFYRGLNSENEVRIVNGMYQSKLQIPKARVEDSGIYICVAVNDKGFTFKNVTLTVVSSEMNMAPSTFVSSNNTAFLISVVFSTIVVFSAVIFTVLLYKKCKSTRKSNARVITVTEAQRLTGIKVESENICPKTFHDQGFSTCVSCKSSTKFQKTRLLTTQASNVPSCTSNCTCSSRKIKNSED